MHADLVELVGMMPTRGRWFNSPVGNKHADPGGPILPRTVSTTVSGVMRRAGLPKRLTAHSLRHTFATRLIERGAGMEKVRELMGHESVATTQECTGITKSQLRDAVDLLPSLNGPWLDVSKSFPFEDLPTTDAAMLYRRPANPTRRTEPLR